MSESYRVRSTCALCRAGGTALQRILSLAPTPPANEFVRAEARDLPQDAIPLTLLLCERCGHAQLAEIVDPGRLFGEYVYVSGTSPVFVAHFARCAADAIARFGLGSDAFVLEAGSNDGTLLKQFQTQGISRVLGVDPAAEIAKRARENGVPTIEGFFSPELAGSLLAENGPAALVCANNVFAHAEDLASFAEAVRAVLAPQGVFVFEVSYLADVVDKLLFDTIYHEHVSYHAILPLLSFFESHGLRLFDCERIDTHGGSIRCFVCLSGADHQRTNRVDTLVEMERERGLFSPATFERFKARISQRAAELRRQVSDIRRSGGRIAGFGAPAKLTTLMHEFGLDREAIEFVVDDSSWKQGLFTPGTHIAVLPSSALYEQKPDWCIIFAWNFAESILHKHASFTAQGGHFLVPLPEVRKIP